MTENKQKNAEQTYENVIAEPTFLPSKYEHKGYTDTFYNEKEDSGAGSFLFGALVGGVIGAATALFLAPKTGQEMRDDFSTQASQLKDKSIELSGIAKDKASEYSAVAKDKASEFATTAKKKTEEVTKTLQEQSGQLTDKIKSMKEKTNIPMDDGTASSEGEEIEFVDIAKEKVEELEGDTSKAVEALKDAVEEKVDEVQDKVKEQ